MAQPLDWNSCPPIVRHVLYSLDWSVVATGRTPTGIAEAFNAWYCELVRVQKVPAPFCLVFDVGTLLTRSGVSYAIAEQRGPGPRSQACLDHHLQWARWLHRTGAADLLRKVRDILASRAADLDTRNEIVRLFFYEILKASSGRPSTSSRRPEWAFPEGENLVSLRIEGAVPAEAQGPRGVPFVLPADLAAWPRPQTIPGESEQIEEFLLNALPREFPEDAVAKLLFLCNAELRRRHILGVINDGLVDECVRFRPLGRSRRQIIRTRPTNQELVDRPSKLEGVYNGVTKVERKADIDPLWHVLPEEYARWWVDEAAGLDHLINRGPLVFKHESPEDIVPERKVLVCFVADAGGDELVRSKLKEEHPAPSTLGLALCYDMVWDAAERVPRREMALEMAVYQLQPGNAQPVRSSLFPLPLVPQRADNYRRLQVMDDTVPEFFYPRDEEGAGRSALDPDPYRFLERELAGAKWHSVYAVVVGAPERLGAILPSARVMLRQGFQHRDGLVLVSLDCRLRRHRAGSFRSFQEGAHAASRGGAYLLPSPEEDIRELFLDTIIGKPMPRRRPTVALTHAPGRPRAATR